MKLVGFQLSGFPHYGQPYCRRKAVPFVVVMSDGGGGARMRTGCPTNAFERTLIDNCIPLLKVNTE